MKTIAMSIVVAFFVSRSSLFCQETTDLSGTWTLTTQTKTTIQNQSILISKFQDYFKAKYNDVLFDVFIENDKIKWEIKKYSSNGSILIEASGVQINENLYMGLTSAKANFLQLDKMKWFLERNP